MPVNNAKETVDKDVVPGPSKATKDFPPPKTDKPRPHICATCTRSFARLEHLKRHERSHTKEKPFECPECTRCFARRDLLLRHQQKLHMTTTPASRPRNTARRESTSSIGPSGGRVRKNSVSGPAVGRPRAATVGHIDTSNLPTPTPGTNTGGGNANMAAATQAKISNTLPRLNTRRVQSISITSGNPSLMALDLDSEGVLFGSGSTINPAALHYNPNHSNYETATSPFDTMFPNTSGTMGMQDDDSYEWMNMLGSGVLSTDDTFDSSSPSAISTASAGGFGEFQESAAWWNNTPNLRQTDYTPPQFTTSPPPPGTISPKDLQAQGQYHEHYYPSMIGQSYSTDGVIYNIGEPYSPTMQQDFVPQTCAYSTVDVSSALNSITDSLRSSLLSTLSRPSSTFGGQNVYGIHQRRYSIAQSPPLGATKTYFPNLPSTADLQRYVAAYFKFYHPHLPFLHVPTLSFSSTINTFKQEEQYISNEYVGGGECLLLSLAAIGALYDAEYSVAKEIFEAAKRMIHISLESCRKASVSAATAAVLSHSQEVANVTPLFLVQSMLLSVIFGLNSGENIVSDIALSHCTGVVNLARSAGLCKQPVAEKRNRDSFVSSEMNNLKSLTLSDNWGTPIKTENENPDQEWFSWIVEEERKRTLYAVHKLSSMLCIAYNHTPALTNSEIRVHLPCNEELWQAESSAIWNSRGGAEAASKSAILFSTALNNLLSAGETSEAKNHQPGNSILDRGSYSNNIQTQATQPQSKPNQFGALSLILALHVYIWETRRLSHARQWSSSEVEAIHAHIEPALRAWEETWGSSSQTSVERPIYFGAEPLPTDNTPLLDLAYIRLFVDLGRSRACLFSRDFQGMVDGLSKNWNDQPSGSSSSPSTNSELTDTPQSATSPASSPTSTVDSPNLLPLKIPSMNSSMHQHFGALSSRHEKHLRRAAFYAADALALSEKSGISCGAFGIKELPMQSLMCAFDSAQVLAEWINAVQERIRPFMGSLDDPSCNLTSIEGLMMLENEDRILLERVFEVLRSAEENMVMEWGEIFESSGEIGLSAKVLKVSAYMLEKAAVWPVQARGERRGFGRRSTLQEKHITTKETLSMAEQTYSA